MEFWGVEVKHGETVKCDPGDLKYLHLSQASLGVTKNDKGAENVPIFVKTNDQKLVLGTLSAEKCAQISYDLVFEKEFELSHSSKNASVHFCGYKTVMHDAFGPEDDISDDEFDSEDEEEMQNVKIMNGKVNANGEQGRPATGKAGSKVVAAAAKPKAKTEKSVKTDKPKADKPKADNDDENDEDEEEDGSDEVSDEDEDMDEAMGDSDDDEDEDEDEDSEEEDEASPKKAENDKKRPANSPSKTPGPAKKAKVEKTGADGKKGGATPTPGKPVGKIPAGSDKSKQQTPKSAGSVSCKSCSKTFGSENALQAHAKAKHNGGK